MKIVIRLSDMHLDSTGIPTRQGKVKFGKNSLRHRCHMPNMSPDKSYQSPRANNS